MKKENKTQERGRPSITCRSWGPPSFTSCNKFEFHILEKKKKKNKPRQEWAQVWRFTRDKKSWILEDLSKQAAQFKFKFEWVHDSCFQVPRNYLQLPTQEDFPWFGFFQIKGILQAVDVHHMEFENITGRTILPKFCEKSIFSI